MAGKDYHDPNRELWQAKFESGLDWGAYLEYMDAKHRERWEAAYERTRLTAGQARLLGSFTRRINLLVLSGAWCGDCVREGPIYQRIAEASTVELRFAERDVDAELTELLRINGAKKVPVAVFLAEDFFEVERFGDRTLSVYRAKAKRELGAACETGLVPPSGEELAAEVQEWVDMTERVHLLLRTTPRLREQYKD